MDDEAKKIFGNMIETVKEGMHTDAYLSGFSDAQSMALHEIQNAFGRWWDNATVLTEDMVKDASRRIAEMEPNAGTN